MKIVEIKIENFKVISEANVTLNGKSVYVTGKNGKGKSSFIQAVFSAIGAEKTPQKAIMEGEHKAKVIIKIAGENKSIIVERVYTESNPKGKLVVKSEDGATYAKPAEFLEQLLGTVWFDMEKFLLLKNTKEMTEFLKEFFKIDTDEIDQLYKNAYEHRAGVNRKFKEKQEQLKLVADATEVVMPDKEALEKEHQEYQAKAQLLSQYDGRIALGKSKMETETNNIRIEETKIEELKKSLEFHENNLKAAQKRLADLQDAMGIVLTEQEELKEVFNSMPNPTTKIGEYQQLAQSEQRYLQKVQLEEDLKIVSDEAIKADADVKRLVEERAKMFEGKGAAGITITEDDILYKGLPLSREQLNTAQLSELAVDIILAVNPTLKTVKFDASVMDNETYNRVLQKIEGAGFQCFVEEVDKMGGDLKIEVIEQ